MSKTTFFGSIAQWSTGLLVLAVLAVMPNIAQAQDDEAILIRIYDVADLIDTNTDQPFEGFYLPGAGGEVGRSSGFVGGGVGRAGGARRGGGGFGGGGGGVGSGGPAGGGGVFRMAPVPAQPRLPAAFNGGENFSSSMQELKDLLVSTVAPDSWLDSGTGQGTIVPYRASLVVGQSKEIHQQLEQTLDLLRKSAAAKNRSITIKAIWLTIDEDQYKSLQLTKNQVVKASALEELVANSGQRGQVTGFNRQTVHIAGGNLKSSVESVVPVVGQRRIDGPDVTMLASTSVKTKTRKKLPAHVMAQVVDPILQQKGVGLGGEQKATDVGYSPVMRWINYGLLLQATPQIKSDSRIQVDLTSIVVRPNRAGVGQTKITSDLSVDRHDFQSQQFRTSVVLNDSTPTLVGGSAIPGSSGNGMQTYLILEAIVAGSETGSN